MSRNVEKRVAELEFRNQQFEAAAKESIGTLQRLEESLAFKTAQKGVSGLESIIKTLNKFNPITNMLNHLTSAFETARQRISVGFFDQIGYDIENLSKKFIDMLGPEYIKTGFSKYEEEIAGVQTIINATGKNTEEVMKYTEKLRWFTDETSYKYEDMISAIGRFTSAGVDIDDAVTSMIGIADAAGYFGVNATNASHAMQGFAQAIGKGYMDSRSWQWIETAKMQTAGFSEALMEAAVAEGTLKKAADGTYVTLKGNEVTASNIKYTLKDQWLTTNALVKVFHKYGDATEEIYKEFERLGGEEATIDIIKRMGDSLDQTGLKAFKASQETKTFTDALEYVRTAVASNWAKTWQLILGNYDEAREMWSSVAEDLYELFVESGQERNALLQQWKESNGRTELLESIRNFYEGIKAAIRPIKAAWEKLFPKTTSDKLLAMTKALNLMSQKFRAVFEGIAEIFEPVVEAVDDFCDDISKRVQVVTEPVERTAELLDKLANAVIHGDYGNGQVRRDALQGLAFSYEEIQNRVNELLGSSFRYEVAQQEIVEGAKEVAEVVEEENEELEEQRFQIENADSRIGRVQRTFAGIYAAGLTFMKVMKEIGSGIVSVFGTIKDEILMPLVDWVLSFTSVWGDSMVEMYAKGEVFESIKKTIQDTVSSVNKWITEFANNFRKKIYPSIGPFFSAVIDFAKKNLPNLWKIVKSGLKIAIGLVTNLWKIIEPFIPTLETIAGFIVDKLTWGIEKLAEYTPTITEKLGGAFEWVSEKVVTLVTNVQELWNQFSISDAWSRLKTSMQGVGELFSDLGQIIHDAFFKIFGANADYDEFAENGPGQAITRSLEPAPEAEDNKNKMLGFVESIANGISDFAEKITAKKEEIKNFFALFTDGLANNIRIIGNSVTNVVNGVKTFGEQSWTGFTNVLTQIDQMSEGSLTTISTSISEFFGSLTETVKNFDTSKLNTVFESVLKGGGLLALLNFSEGFANIGNNLAAVPRTFNELLLTAQGTLLSYQKKINATNLEKIAKAIGILALSVVGLTFVDQDKLSSATGSIIALGLVAAAILKVAAPWIEAKAKLEGVKATAKEAQETQKMIADNGPAVLLSIFVQPLKELATGLSNAARIWAGKHKTSVFLISVGITLTLIMNVLERMKELQKDYQSFKDAMYNVGFIVLALLGFAFLMSKISKTTESMKENESTIDKKFGLGASLAIVALALSLMIIVKAIGEFAELWNTYSYEQMTQSLGGIVIIMIGIAGVMLAASKLTNGLSVVGTLLGMTVFLTAMILPVYLLGNMPVEVVKQGITSLIIMMTFVGVLTIFLAAAEALSGSIFFGLDMIAMAGGIVMIVGAMVLAAKALETFESYSWGSLLSGVLKMSAVLAVLVSVVIILGRIPDKGNGILKIVGSIALLAVAAALIAKAIPAIVDGLIYLGQAIQEHGQEIATAVGAIIVLILGIIIANETHIINCITTVLSTALGAILGFLDGNKMALIAAVVMVVMILLGALEALIPGTVDKILTILIKLLYSLALGISRRGADVLAALGAIIVAVGHMFFEALMRFLKQFGKFGDWLADQLGLNEDFLTGKENWEKEIETKMNSVSDSTAEGVEGIVDNVVTGGQGAFTKAGSKLSDSATKVGEDTNKSIMDSFSLIPDTVKQQLGLTNLNAEEGMNKFAEIMSEHMGLTIGADQAAGALASGMDWTGILSEKGDMNGEVFDNEFADALMRYMDKPESSAETVSEEAGEAGAGVAGEGGENTGEEYDNGIVRGMQRNRSNVLAAARQLGLDTVASGNGAFNINSPSKEGMRTGMYYVMGIANAIRDYTYLSAQASEDLSYKTIDSTRNALYNVTQALNSDLDTTSPVITPVLDLSDVRGGLSNVNGLFDETRKSLSGASMSVTNTIRHRDELAKEMANANNKALMDKLDNLNGSLGTLGTSMSGLQIVMDSGTLVGEIASPMDSELGIRTQRRIRGV